MRNTLISIDIRYNAWFPVVQNQVPKKKSSFYFVRDGQSGKLTVDDYGAKTGRSPGKMRQLNINGPLYVGVYHSQLII